MVQLENGLTPHQLGEVATNDSYPFHAKTAMLLFLSHYLIVTAYLLCPVVGGLYATVWTPRDRRRRAVARLQLTILCGCGIGILVCVAYAFVLHGRLVLSQVILTSYLATSLILLLQWADFLLWRVSRKVFRLGRSTDSEGGSNPSPAVAAVWWYNLRAFLALLCRAALIFTIGLPYVLATVLTYRPKVASTTTPESMYRWAYEPVQFDATDGVSIAGWWIPSPGPRSTRTVLICPGSNGDKATQLFLAKRLLPAGYNVLIFDFRAHGSSGGQLCTFGDLERRDVLGAMRWLRQTHPDACKKVAGIGVSSGGAALLAAAADPSDEGQNIDAIAIYDSYDRLDHLVSSLVDQFVPSPMSIFVNRFALPMAGLQVGTRLTEFAPADQIKQIWPRPVLVIHGLQDEFIPFERGESLYDCALEPKMNFWIDRCNHGDALKNDDAAKLVKRCFDLARRVI